MKRLPCCLLLSIFLATLSPAPAAPVEKKERPNIVVILFDDMGYSDLGCYGGEISTPNIDRLAAEGIRFRQFFNSAKCEPSRASLMTGQYWQDAALGAKRGATLGEAMQHNGYRTLAVGKWHLDGNPVDRGFDRYFGHLSGASSYFATNSSWRLDGERWQSPKDGTFYATDAMTDYSIDFIKEAVALSPPRPFFLYLAYNAPHSPLHALPKDIARYEKLYREKGWDRIRSGRLAKQRELGIFPDPWQPAPLPPSIPKWGGLGEKDAALEIRRMAVYAAMIDRLDWNIGRLVKKLKDLGIADDTLIMLLSDNGANPFDSVRKGVAGSPDSAWLTGFAWASVSNTPLRNHKRNMHNGGNMTPCILWWPGHVASPGSLTDVPANIIDIMPTVIDLASGNYPEEKRGAGMPPLPGISLTPVLAGENLPQRDFYFHLMDHRAVYDGTWKLVSDFNAPWSLYNIEKDRAETTDLIKANPEKAAELRAKYDSWWETRKVHHFRNAGSEPYYVLPTGPIPKFDGEDPPKDSAKQKREIDGD